MDQSVELEDVKAKLGENSDYYHRDEENYERINSNLEIKLGEVTEMVKKAI